jgi:hypothetical protein
MDAAYLSAAAALSGSIIGGLTSLAASWMSQNSQSRMQQATAERARRQTLYRSFIEEASRLYGKALVTEKGEVTDFVNLYAMLSRMRVDSTPAVVRSAEAIVELIIDTYFEPNKTLRDLMPANGERPSDLLKTFSEVCRDELRGARSGC